MDTSRTSLYPIEKLVRLDVRDHAEIYWDHVGVRSDAQVWRLVVIVLSRCDEAVRDG